MALNLIMIMALNLVFHLCLIRFKNFVSNEITFKLFTLIYAVAAFRGL